MEAKKRELKAFLIENIEDLADDLLEIPDVLKLLKQEIETVERMFQIIQKNDKIWG